MYPRQSTIRLQLTPQQSEFLYWELLGLLDYYQADSSPALDPQEESTLRQLATALEAGLKRAEAIADLQLQQLRAITTRPVAA